MWAADRHVIDSSGDPRGCLAAAGEDCFDAA